MPKLGAGSSKKQQCQICCLQQRSVDKYNEMDYSGWHSSGCYEQIFLYAHINPDFQSTDEGATTLKKEMEYCFFIQAV